MPADSQADLPDGDLRLETNLQDGCRTISVHFFNRRLHALEARIIRYFVGSTRVGGLQHPRVPLSQPKTPQ